MSGPVAIIHSIPISYQHLLFSELAGTGLEFEVLFTAAASVHRPERIRLDEATYRFRVGYEGYYEEAPPLHSFLFVLKSLESLRPSVVIIPGWSDAAAWAAWLWALTRRRPRILWMESTAEDHQRTMWKELFKRIYVKPFHLAHVYGTKSKEYMCELGFSAERVLTGRVLVNNGLFAPGECARSRATRRILYVGRLAAEKNLETLLRAFRIALSRQTPARLSLVLVGSGPEESRLRALAAALGIQDHVEFRGAITQDGLPPIYQSADVLVLPSVSEPWGLVVNEAMLCGLPAIVSDRCGCAPDLITPGTGWTFPPLDAEGLARRLIEVAGMPEQKLSEMGRAARMRALAYSPAKCARSVVSCVEHARRRGRAHAVSQDSQRDAHSAYHSNAR